MFISVEKVTARGSTWKEVRCEYCGCHFGYQMSRATSSSRPYGVGADASAREKLEEALAQEVEPIACPDCGKYQADMVAELEKRRAGEIEERSSGGMLGVITGISGLGVFAGAFGQDGSFVQNLFTPVTMISGLVLAGSIALGNGIANSRKSERFDPNADAASRAGRTLPANGTVARIQ